MAYVLPLLRPAHLDLKWSHSIKQAVKMSQEENQLRRIWMVIGLLLGLLAGCSENSPPPVELSSSQPSLLFFYTEG